MTLSLTRKHFWPRTFYFVFCKILKQGGRIILKRIFNKCDEQELTGLIWLRIGTGGGPL